MLIDFIAAGSFWIIPYLTGRILTRGTLNSFALGGLFWFITFFLISGFTGFFHFWSFQTVIYALVVLISAVSIARIIIEHQSFRLSDKIPFLILGIIGTLVYFLVWKIQTPYPLQLNWDIYEHITLANKLSEGIFNFQTSSISDTFTFNSYPPLFHALLSIPKIVFHTNLLGVYYYLEYFYFLLTIIITFLLARKIFQNSWVSLTAGLFAIFIFENFMVYTSFFLIPQNLTALLTAYALIYVSEENINKLLLGGVLLTIFLMHYIIGILGIFIILSFMAFRKASSKKLNWLVLSSALGTVLLLGLHNWGNTVLTNREEAVHFTFSLAEKTGFLLNWYSLSFLFLPIACFYILKNGTKDQKVILILALLSLGLSLAPASYFLKFFVFDHYLLNIILAAGAGILILNLPRIIKAATVLWIGFSLLIVFFESQAAFKEPLGFEGKQTHISQSEINVSDWVSKHFGNDTLLISDPGTQYILEAASGINSQGGVYMSAQSREILSEIKDSSSSQMIKEKLAGIEDQLDYEKFRHRKTLVVFSGRYFAWQNLPRDQKLSSYYNIWQPQNLSPEELNYIKSLTVDERLKLVYQNKELVILEL